MAASKNKTSEDLFKNLKLQREAQIKEKVEVKEDPNPTIIFDEPQGLSKVPNEEPIKVPTEVPAEVPAEAPKNREEKPKETKSGVSQRSGISQVKNMELFATLKKKPSKKKRVVVTIDSNIADYLEEQNKNYEINNLSYIYNELLKEALKGVL